jgi:hypothetical protein
VLVEVISHVLKGHDPDMPGSPTEVRRREEWR